MIPEKGKTYRIDYFSNNPVISEYTFYKGPATYTGDQEDDDLYIFTIPDEPGYYIFAEEDIVEELEEIKDY